MQSKQFSKKYIAIVQGHLENKSGTINLPIDRKENSIIERCVSCNGSPAITYYQVLNSKEKENQSFDVIQCILETGRTHQIRVHLASLGHPLLGDTLYGTFSSFISRQALHAYIVEFVHPISKEKVMYEAPIPEDFKVLL